MAIRWTKANYCTTAVFRIKWKICQKPYQKARYICKYCKLNIVWNTRNFSSLFQIKVNTKHYNCLIYEIICLCGKNYVGKSVRNFVLRWAVHEDPDKQFERAKHWKYFPNHHDEKKNFRCIFNQISQSVY